MYLKITVKGLDVAIPFFKRLDENLRLGAYEGMLDAADKLAESISQVVPHKGYHLERSGADYHIFAKLAYPAENLVVCGPTAPYVLILEYGSGAVMGEFEPVYRTTKQGQLLSGLRFTYKGTPDIFFIRPGTIIPPKHYLRNSLEHAWDRMKSVIRESVVRRIKG